MIKIQSPTRLIWVSLLIAWCFDFLFWKKTPGISFFLFVLLCLAGGLFFAFQEKLRPAFTSWILIVPVLFFSAMTFLRLEGFTQFLDVILSLGLMALLAMTLMGGRWPMYSLVDYLVNGGKLTFSSITKGAQVIQLTRQKSRESRATEGRPATPKPVGAVFRGIGIAIPVVGILAALLASADPVFEQGLRSILNVFHLDKLGEYIFRAVYILLIAYLLIGIFTHSLSRSSDEKLIGMEKPWLPAFLGFTETAILLASVDLLFAAFVGVQFRYFFGGQANINLAGYTYAEYARRGFSELVMVAILSLLLILGTGSISRREHSRQKVAYRGLVILLVSLVLVILVSALQRLLLYESAYGFTSLRTYTHIFIPWLGVLLVATAVLEVIHRPRVFACALLLVSIGFGVTLNLINVDKFIVQQNVQLAVQKQPLDTAYLANLSGDSVPELVKQFRNPELPQDTHDLIGKALACRLKNSADLVRDTHWQAYQVAAERAKALMTQIKPELEAYTAEINSNGSMCYIGGDM